MALTLDDIDIRTTPKPGDLGYITYMHGILYDFGQGFENYVAVTLAEFFETFDPARERIWMAEYQGEIVGHLILKHTDGWAQLRYFLIRPEYRGIGLGKRLMQLFMEFFHEAGYQKSFLLTTDGLRVSAKIYERYGYQLVDSRMMDIDLKEHRFELHLA